MHNLILCGFMGCGKTTVGWQLARKLDLEYVDLDAEIEREAGMPIPQIFSKYGEPAFRDLEHHAVAGLARRINCVVSTGGGTLTYPRNVEVIDRKHDLVVFLDAGFDVCYERIKDSDRPLVRSNSQEQLRQIFEQRRPLYLAAAGLRVDAGAGAQQVADEIIRLRGLV